MYVAGPAWRNWLLLITHADDVPALAADGPVGTLQVLVGTVLVPLRPPQVAQLEAEVAEVLQGCRDESQDEPEDLPRGVEHDDVGGEFDHYDVLRCLVAVDAAEDVRTAADRGLTKATID